MSGLHLSISVQDHGVLTALNRLIDSGQDTEPALKEIGEYLVQAHEQRFAEQRDPDGQPWAPLSPKYQARKKRHPDLILVLNEYLADSWRYRASGNELLFGTNLIYAATHHFGDPGRNIPERPILGINEDDAAEITDIINDYISTSFKG